MEHREYAKPCDLSVGLHVQVDDGFPCLKPWSVEVIHKDDHGFYINCSEGRHYLAEHIDDDGTLIGVYNA